jgi:hypothetical protein
VTASRAQVALTIGRLDRALSELKMLAQSDLDEADLQTVRHHAEDYVGLGTKVLEMTTRKRGSRRGQV